jgi:hypothetical protein
VFLPTNVHAAGAALEAGPSTMAAAAKTTTHAIRRIRPPFFLTEPESIRLPVTGPVRITDDCRLATITDDKVLELYYQNPKFGLFLIRLVSGYLRRAREIGAPGLA